MAAMMQAILFTMVVLAPFCSVIAVSPLQSFVGYCQAAGGKYYNLCVQDASSREACKQSLLRSSSAVGAYYEEDNTGSGVCNLGFTAGILLELDGSCLRTEIGYPDGSAHGYPVGGDGSAQVTCYAKGPIQSFDVTHKRIEELLVFQEDSSRAVMYNVLTGAMWVSAAIAMTIGGVVVMRLRSFAMRGGGLVTAEPLLG